MSKIAGKVVFNQIRFQREARDISTCARWCALRLKFIEWDEGRFNSFIRGCRNLNIGSWDDFVTLATLCSAPMKTPGPDLLK